MCLTILIKTPHELLKGKTCSQRDRWSVTPDFPVRSLSSFVTKQTKGLLAMFDR